jgi:hypothetical protein
VLALWVIFIFFLSVPNVQNEIDLC